MSEQQTQALLVLLAALVARGGGNVKVKRSELTKINGKEVVIQEAPGFIRIKIGSAT